MLRMVSQFGRCLGDLLYRARIGELNMRVVSVVSNHPRERMNISLIGDIPFHYLPLSKETKAEQEAQVKEIIQSTGTELVVLARYMQILFTTSQLIWMKVPLSRRTSSTLRTPILRMTWCARGETSSSEFYRAPSRIICNRECF